MPHLAPELMEAIRTDMNNTTMLLDAVTISTEPADRIFKVSLTMRNQSTLVRHIGLLESARHYVEAEADRLEIDDLVEDLRHAIEQITQKAFGLATAKLAASTLKQINKESTA
ncbi:hypothetical protein CLV78_105225 [Aliiruegeria haliotis]|uniref:Uncharacterized protein n=1 Tax=Aliiruegeria haliotis TaxID=1280846 RepID=A0A2T0RPU3_9RHOB|nr:hypothetical protein [Aliiruegeria haliotis]PRY23171.1 hypothetical protein CLV78_105225 [Aliiruegeria haliotis]